MKASSTTCLHIIPVIDLLDGQVVHAREGMRDRYRPVHSEICADASPEGVLLSYRSLYPFRTVYVADLNAILGRGDNLPAIAGLLRRFGDLEIWLDAGGASLPLADQRLRCVFGTESGVGTAQLTAPGTGSAGAILSLDFFGSDLRGSLAVMDRAWCWPEDVIVLNISRVGSRSGPDLKLLERILAAAGGRRIYLGGGIRNREDLKTVQRAGAAGVLLATALYEGTITATDLKDFRQKKTPA